MSLKKHPTEDQPFVDGQQLDKDNESELLIQREIHENLAKIINEQILIIENLESQINLEKEEKKALQKTVNQKDLIIQDLVDNQKEMESRIAKRIISIHSNLISNLESIDEIEKDVEYLSKKAENIREMKEAGQIENLQEIEKVPDEEIEEEEEVVEKTILSLEDISPMKVTISIFNDLCLNMQLFVISKIFPELMNNEITEYFVKITNFLIYLMQFMPEDTKVLTILVRDSDQFLIEIDKEVEINVLYNVTEKLYQLNLLESRAFIGHLNEIRNVSIEIKFPSEFFRKIFRTIKLLKETVVLNLDIGIFITGIKNMDITFRNDKDINILRIGPSVTDIEDGYFFGGAFYNCVSLKKVTISPSVKFVGENLFYGCTALTDLTIPRSVKIIGMYSFKFCTSLEEVKIPSSVVEIDSGAFAHCTSLRGLKIPKSVHEIENNAFEECTLFTKIVIPSSIKKLGPNAFLNCELLSEVLFEEPAKLEEIKKGTFKGCSSLRKITFPQSIRSVEEKIFEDCPNLEEIKIYSSLIKIHKEAFPPNVEVVVIE